MPEAANADFRAQGDPLGNADYPYSQVDDSVNGSACVSLFPCERGGQETLQRTTGQADEKAAHTFVSRAVPAFHMPVRIRPAASLSPLNTEHSCPAKRGQTEHCFPPVAVSSGINRRRAQFGMVLRLLLLCAAAFSLSGCLADRGGISLPFFGSSPNTEHQSPNTSPDESVQDYLVHHGKRMILGGAIAAVIGLALAIALKQIALQHVGAFVGYGGLMSMGVGILLAKMASWWLYIGWGVAVISAITAVVLLREHGLDAWLLSKVSVRPKQPKAIRVRRPQAIQVPGSERTISIPLGEAPSDQPSDPEEGEASE